MSVEHHDIAVIGSGFSGLGMAIGLRREGYEDFVVLERAETLGGTWRDNHYPGCTCDVPTPLYSFSFAPNPDWSHFYARSGELRAYLERCAEEFGVRSRIRFRAGVKAAAWREAEQRWHLVLEDGRELTARVVIGGFGGLTQAAWPAIPGIEEFSGELMHSADWDHDVPLKGRRVGVIGTGASAVQLIPHVAAKAGHTTVFQRTPGWVFPKLDRRFSALEKRIFRRFPVTLRALREMVFWFGESVAFGIVKRPGAMRLIEAVARAQRRFQVRDPELRRKLRPGYRAGCKRMLVTNDFYPALARPDVHLVTEGIDRIEPGGVVTGGGEMHELDVLVCATGFDLQESFTRISIAGRDGLTVEGAWAASGFEAHRGTMVSGFPNLMILCGPNTGTGSTSQVYMIEAQIGYALEALRAMRESRAAEVEVTAEAQASYNAWIDERMKPTVWLTGGCNSWYLQDGHNGTLYPNWSSDFARRMRKFRPHEHRMAPARTAEPVAAA